MVKDPTRSTKLQPFYEGPYKVLRRNRGGSYLLLDHDNTLLPRPAAPVHTKLVHAAQFTTSNLLLSTGFFSIVAHLHVENIWLSGNISTALTIPGSLLLTLTTYLSLSSIGILCLIPLSAANAPVTSSLQLPPRLYDGGGCHICLRYLISFPFPVSDIMIGTGDEGSSLVHFLIPSFLSLDKLVEFRCLASPP